MMVALDAGAEDVAVNEDSYEITTAPEDFLTVSDALEKEGIAAEASEVAMVPDNYVKLEGDAPRQWPASPANWKNSMMYRKCTPTQNFRKTWNNPQRKNRENDPSFSPFFFLCLGFPNRTGRPQQHGKEKLFQIFLPLF